jgi:hypothetical protein
MLAFYAYELVARKLACFEIRPRSLEPVSTVLFWSSPPLGLDAWLHSMIGGKGESLPGNELLNSDSRATRRYPSGMVRS